MARQLDVDGHIYGEEKIKMSTEALATFASNLTFEQLPDDVVNAAKLAILDALGTAFAGMQTEHGKIAHDFALGLGGRPESTLIGSPKQAAAPHVAFANCIAGRAHTFDDVQEQGITHPGCAVVFSALAVAQRQGASGKEFLTAVVAGYDLSLRVAFATSPSHYERGFHTTGTTGVFGAAAAAGSLLGLTPEQIAMALGIAGDQAASTRQYQIDGTVANSAIHAATAAQNGVFSALLAAKNFPASPTILEGKWGFLATFCPEYDLEPLTDGLGERFMVSKTSFKLYPSCRYIHGGVDAMLRALRQENPDLDDIDEVKIETFEAAQVECDRPNFDSVLQAQFSLQYNLAIAARTGLITLADFEPDRLQDPATVALAERMQISHNPELDKEYPRSWPYIARVRLKDGRLLEERVDYPPGSPQNPVTEQDLVAKYRSLAEPVLGSDAGELADRIFGLENVDDVCQLHGLLSGEPEKVLQ